MKHLHIKLTTVTTVSRETANAIDIVNYYIRHDYIYTINKTQLSRYIKYVVLSIFIIL